MEWLSAAVIAAVFTGVGALLGKGIEFFRARHSASLEQQAQEAKIKSSETEQAVALYREIISALRDDLKKLFRSLQQLEADHLKCREENAALRTEVKGLTKRVKTLEEELRSALSAGEHPSQEDA